MKKVLLVLSVISIFLLASCSDSKTFKRSDGSTFTAEPYGWANKDANKMDGVVYEASIPDIAVSVIFSAGLFIPPIICTGWYLFEPVRYVEESRLTK